VHVKAPRNTSLPIALAAVAFAACGGNVVVDSGSTGGTGGTGATTTTTWTTGVGAGTTTTTWTTGVGAGTTTTPTTTWTTSTTNVGGFGGGSTCSQDVDCPSCCVDQNIPAYEEYVSLVLKLCACGSPMMKCFGPCSDPGEDACSDTWSLGEACIDCLNAEFEVGNPCGDQAASICAQQPACSEMIDCFTACP
jgi:hypothetical protein